MLVLASTSPYRATLLGRLGLPFTTERPRVDETPLPGEAPRALALRLAEAKAVEVAARLPGAWVIGSDQVAELDGAPIGKPGDHAGAVAQLAAASGRELCFHTGLCLARARPDHLATACDLTVVRLRPLDASTIERYLHAEQPYDCAGSFKSEGLGISLFEAIRTEDPSALVGLPLIALAGMLRAVGFQLP